MIKQFCIFFIFLFISTIVFSQTKTVEYAVKAGVNISKFIPNDEIEGYYTFNSRTGFHIGALLQYPISNKFSIKPELLLTTIFSEAEIDQIELHVYDPTIDRNGKYDIKEYLISLPILINFKADKHFDIETGFPVSYVIASKVTPQKDIPITYTVKDKFQVEWQLGVGYLIANKYRIALGINAGLTERNNTRSNTSYLGLEYFF